MANLNRKKNCKHGSPACAECLRERGWWRDYYTRYRAKNAQISNLSRGQPPYYRDAPW